MWLVRSLELTRILVLEDLRVAKSLCTPCFPPAYNIADKYVEMYHSALSQYLKDIIAEGLDGNEYVTLLAWTMNTYPGPDLMKNPDLNIDVESIGPLLSPDILENLQDQYLKYVYQNYENWMKNTLDSEKADWAKSHMSYETIRETYYHTIAPVIIFQMIDDNLKVISSSTHSSFMLQQLDPFSRSRKPSVPYSPPKLSSSPSNRSQSTAPCTAKRSSKSKTSTSKTATKCPTSPTT